jgi:hypothetical protein
MKTKTKLTAAKVLETLAKWWKFGAWGDAREVIGR